MNCNRHNLTGMNQRRFCAPFFLVAALLSQLSQVAYADAEEPYIVEGLSIEMSFDEAVQRLEQSGYANRRPVTENRKGRNVTYNKVASRKGSIKSHTVQLFERQLDMDMALSEIRAKLFNPAGESGKALEYQRLTGHFGADAPECKNVSRKLICKLTLQDGPVQTTIEGKFDPNWIVYNISREYLEDVEDPFDTMPSGPPGPAPPMPVPPVTGPPSNPPTDPPVTAPIEPVPGGPPAPGPTPLPEEPEPEKPPETTAPEDAGPGEPPNEENLSAQEQFELAQQYESGDGVSQSHSKAAQLYEMAAEKNHAESQFALGLKYLKGEGVPKDLEKAAELFRQAAENGLAEARYNLAVMLETGQGVGQNQAEAIDNFREAAEQGEANAQLSLGKHYLTGTGVEQSDSQAFEWVKKSADQGNTKAQFLLAGLYESGIGTEKDIDEAIEWYKEANSKEFKPAQEKLYALGIDPYPSLQSGEGRERNAASIPYD